jgi:hypothetical protein
VTKVDITNVFYRIYINPADIPKLGVVFPTEPMVVFLLQLLMC